MRSTRFTQAIAYLDSAHTHHFTVNHFACSSHLLALASREKTQQQPPLPNKANTREQKEQMRVCMCLVSLPQEPPSTDKLAVLLKLIDNKCSQSAVTQLRFTLFSFHFAFRFLFFLIFLSIFPLDSFDEAFGVPSAISFPHFLQADFESTVVTVCSGEMR